MSKPPFNPLTSANITSAMKVVVGGVLNFIGVPPPVTGAVLFTANELGIYKKIFDIIDSDKDGYITPEDIASGLNNIVGHFESDEELQKDLKEAVPDKSVVQEWSGMKSDKSETVKRSGAYHSTPPDISDMIKTSGAVKKTFTFEEFIKYVSHSNKFTLDKASTNLFQKWDTNKDGFLDLKEVESAVSQLGLDAGAAKNMMKVADLNGDGKISLTEFKKAFNNKNFFVQ